MRWRDGMRKPCSPRWSSNSQRQVADLFNPQTIMVTRMRKPQGPDTTPQQKREPMPMLLFFLAVHCGMGVAFGVAVAALIVLFNVAGLKDLLATSSEPIIPTFMLFALFALTFGSLKMGIAIMMLPYDDRRGSDGDEPPEPPSWH